MMQIWKAVVGFESIYEVSNDGAIRNKKTLRQLKQHPDKNGYLRVPLCDSGTEKTVPAHRVVLFAFVPNENIALQCNHKNGIKYDNRIENLEWVTGKENVNHAYQVLKAFIPKGVQRSNHKLTESDVLEIRRICETKIRGTFKRLASVYNVRASTIQKIYHRQKWKHI